MIFVVPVCSYINWLAIALMDSVECKFGQGTEEPQRHGSNYLLLLAERIGTYRYLIRYLMSWLV